MTQITRGKRNFPHLLFRKFLHGLFFMRRGLTLGVRLIIQADDGKFLLVRHTYTPGWHFPGGGVEIGQTMEQAVRSELRQETGLHLVGKPALHGMFYNNLVSKRDHVLVYRCDAKGSLQARPRSLEILAAEYFDYDKLPLDTERGTARRIQEVVSGAKVSEYW